MPLAFALRHPGDCAGGEQGELSPPRHARPGAVQPQLFSEGPRLYAATAIFSSQFF